MNKQNKGLIFLYGAVHLYAIRFIFKQIDSPFKIVFLGLGILVLIQYGRLLLSKTQPESNKDESLFHISLLIILTGGIGALFTFLLTRSFSFATPTLSSSFMGLAGGLLFGVLFKDEVHSSTLQASFFCGTFAGMTSGLLFDSLLPIFSAGLISGSILGIPGNALKGYGGKLGSTAFMGILLMARVSGKLEPGEMVTGFSLSSGPLFMLGAVSVFAVWINLFLLHKKIRLFKNRILLTAVILSSGTSLLFYLLCLIGNGVSPSPLWTLAPLYFYGASFAGMSGENIVHPPIILSSFILGGLFCIIANLMISTFQGFGGGLGTSACISVVILQIFYIRKTRVLKVK